jgi:predicted GNAT family N-acyltransferase
LPGQHQARDFSFEALGPQHDWAVFSCGVDALDRYLHQQAAQDVKKRVAAVFVLTPDGKTIAGYYVLSQYSVELDRIPKAVAKRVPKYAMVPATLIGRLAVSRSFQGRGLGEFILMDALHRCLAGSRQVASAAVIVDAKDQAAAAFYAKYGFLELPEVPTRFFLPMATIDKMFA